MLANLKANSWLTFIFNQNHSFETPLYKVCVYLKGKRIVDLAASTVDSAYNADSLQVCTAGSTTTTTASKLEQNRTQLFQSFRPSGAQPRTWPPLPWLVLSTKAFSLTLTSWHHHQDQHHCHHWFFHSNTIIGEGRGGGSLLLPKTKTLSPRVTKHWPEFGSQPGKELITVADLICWILQLDNSGRCDLLNITTGQRWPMLFVKYYNWTKVDDVIC